MKSSALVCAIAAASFAFGPLAQAQDNDGRERRDRQGWQQRDGQRDGQRDNREQRRAERDGRHHGGAQQAHRIEGRADHRNEHRADHRSDRRHVQQFEQRHEQRGHAYSGHRFDRHHPQFHRGGYVPAEYRQHRYYVNDWRSHRLSAPPYGYQWVQSDSGDFLLMALATGLIANLIFSNY